MFENQFIYTLIECEITDKTKKRKESNRVYNTKDLVSDFVISILVFGVYIPL